MNATSGATTTSATTGADGRYALELAPGSYSVCCTNGVSTVVQCASVAVTAGSKTRVDVTIEASPGGVYCNTVEQ